MRKTWDKIGIGLSSLCLIHCLIAPVMAASFPLWKRHSSANETTFHQVIFALIFLLATMAFIPKLHRPEFTKIISLALCALLLIGLGSFIEVNFFGGYAETILTTLGSLMLIYAHRINLKGCTKRHA